MPFSLAETHQSRAACKLVWVGHSTGHVRAKDTYRAVPSSAVNGSLNIEQQACRSAGDRLIAGKRPDNLLLPVIRAQYTSGV